MRATYKKKNTHFSLVRTKKKIEKRKYLKTFYKRRQLCIIIVKTKLCYIY